MNPIRCQIFEDVLFIWPSKYLILLWNCDDMGKWPFLVKTAQEIQYIDDLSLIEQNSVEL